MADGNKENNIIRMRLIRSYVSSVVSISLVLVLIGIAGLIAVNARAVADHFRENLVVEVIMSETAEEQDALDYLTAMKGMPFVKSAEYVSREKGTQQMEDILGKDFLNAFQNNPVPISVDFHIAPQYLSADSLAKVKAVLGDGEKVREVVIQESLVDSLNKSIRSAGIVMLVFIILLLFISFVLIGNTVRLNLYARRFTIHTMQLVGATKSFIRKPFIVQAMWQGLISGVIADFALLLLLYFAKKNYGEFFAIFDSRLLAGVLAAVLVIGVVLCILSAMRVVNRLVDESKDDLYY
jgi:cell division transport system permease protein